MKLETAKGVRDFGPEEKIVRQELLEKLTEIFEKYGYSPIETPIIERYDVLAAKFAAGEESDSMKETFKLSDQGKRKLGLRFDLTLPFSRFIAMNPNLKMPFKRYQIGRVYRDGPIKLGRYREFLQCDVDIVGTKNMIADTEMILIADAVFKNIGFEVELFVNNKKILESIIDYVGIPKGKWNSSIIIIDKLKKITRQEMRGEFKKIGVGSKIFEKLMGLINQKGENLDKIANLEELELNESGKQGLSEIKEIFSYAKSLKLKNVTFDVSLARGFSYYTGTVFEGYLRDSKITSSVCGGGRYDEMIGNYARNEREYPAVGISFGLEPIIETLKLRKENLKKTVTQVYIIPIRTMRESLSVAEKLRKQGLKVDMDTVGKGISANLGYANTLSIPYVLFIGENELKQGKLKLRDMKTGKEYSVSEEQIKDKIRI